MWRHWTEAPVTDVGTTRLLTGHFLRRFLDNDLLSPSGDGHEHAALVVSGLFVVGLWASFALVLKSLSPFLSPFGLLLSTLNDKYVGLAVTMIVTALGAVIEWDALGLDRRDSIVLGPLPISTRVLLLAKIRALALFVVMFAIALGALPGVLYPPLQAATLGVGVVGTFWMTAVHLAVSLAASTFASSMASYSCTSRFRSPAEGARERARSGGMIPSSPALRNPPK